MLLLPRIAAGDAQMAPGRIVAAAAPLTFFWITLVISLALTADSMEWLMIAIHRRRRGKGHCWCQARCSQCDTRLLHPYTSCALIDEELKTEEEILSRVCYLWDNYLGVLLKLFCIKNETLWSIVVDKPSICIGSVTAWKLPVGQVDKEEERLFSFEINEIEEAFGLQLNMSDLTNSALVLLRVVPLNEMWKVSADVKIKWASFLLEKANLQDDDFDDNMSVNIQGRRFVSSMMSTVQSAKSIDLSNKK